MIKKNIPVIAVDGPGGTGKGTLSLLLAKELQWHLLDSGALYRVLAFDALKKNIDLKDESALANLANHLDVKFISPIGEHIQVILHGKDVTEQIRTEQCGSVASLISVFPQVRTGLITIQHNFRQPPGLVADGRDMGTVLFPDAILKIFLTANQEERAKRRYNQLKKQGINVSLPDILNDLKQRDFRDQSRPVSPMQPAADAVQIDTSQLNVAEVFAIVMQKIAKLNLV